MDTLARRHDRDRQGDPEAPGAVPRAPTPVPDAGLPAVPVRRPRGRGFRIPPHAWAWWETPAVGVVVGLTVVVVVLIQPDRIDPAALASTSAVVAHAITLLGSVLLYIHWRLTGDGPLAWLVLGLAAIAAHALALSGLVAAEPAIVQRHPVMPLLTHVAMGAGLLLVANLAGHRCRTDPLLAGVVVGGGVFVGLHVALAQAPAFGPSASPAQHLAAVGLTLELAIALGVALFPRAPRWVRYRLAVALAVLAIGHAATYPVPRGPLHSVFAVGCHVLGATLLCGLTIALLRRSIRDNRSAVRSLRDRVVRLEEGVRTDRAQLHEIRATIAGISTAAQVVQDSAATPPVRRAAIRDMMDAEIERLVRLMRPPSRSPLVEVDLDAVLGPLVVRQLAQRRPLRWEPSGLTVAGRADEVAEVVDILLENAAQHGQGAPVELTAERCGDAVEVRVSDSGPGVPSQLRESIFEWGRSGPHSTGEGIGLNVARRLSEGIGAYLGVEATPAPGATFVLRMSAAEEVP